MVSFVDVHSGLRKSQQLSPQLVSGRVSHDVSPFQDGYYPELRRSHLTRWYLSRWFLLCPRITNPCHHNNTS
ncbi:hypothetical protein Y032_0048g1619 [Ancylostoma ceylanicum]|uniref:Uncharacterized protein n=1 Tax=Ancylostoma ceylanicum TaxID=53326 RepID=A0A016UAD7_9BILA|nr:hypothetical protein Y032_0048g1619 [Ancylostoma ceylanicum]